MNIYAQDLYEAYRLPHIPPVPSLLPTLEQLQYDRGEERLMLAVLKDAIECIERYRRDHGARSRTTYLDALRWVRSHNHTWLFSFENVCLGLGLDPSRLRSVLDPKLGHTVRVIHEGTSHPTVLADHPSVLMSQRQQ